ncbi:DNRLRE domain-containing protein [bacterium]|nr:DNRLRE domain-containing protein [bacterium]
MSFKHSMKIVWIAYALLSTFILSMLYAQKVEIKGKRTLYSNTYKDKNDKCIVEISAAPINYRDSKGEYQPIDQTILKSASEYDFEVVQGLYHAYFKRDLSAEYPVVFETKDGANLKMKLTSVGYYDIRSKMHKVISSVNPTEPMIAENVIVYPDVFKGVDLKFSYGTTRLKEEIWVNDDFRENLPNPEKYGMKNQSTYLVFITQIDLDGAPRSFARDMKIKKSNFEGSDPIEFRNLNGDIKFFLPIDWAYLAKDRMDLHEDLMVKIHRRIIHTDEGYFLLAGIKLSQLKKMSKGTVIFDPQVVFQPNYTLGCDAKIIYKNNYTRHNYNYGAHYNLHVGRTYFSSFDKCRTLINFDLSELIPSTATVNSATLSLYCNYSFGSVSTVLDVHKMITEWTEGNNLGTNGYICWNKPMVSASTWNGGSAGTDYVSSVSATITKAAANVNQWFDWNVENIVQDWVNNQSGNHGLIIKSRDDHVATQQHKFFQFYSSDYTTASFRPKLVVEYTTNDFARTTYYIRDAVGNVIATYEM